ncbi:hypothetical protein B5S28_g5219 [[Candida] boidinii]|uniref:Unnamed protein product n=1 Tax=Candida boidinii TaxID=5477 RepID=A0ACB5TJW4_CANBO|nr:hypothetical protein B5S28_g5219 [[Candida] boidinii]OWB64274.1 hypothetical protein B5S29_g5336 [[Candida] boidinii]OWB75303.1 hypothetical protein B5S31_g5184 [[Candida] boidinii]OWB81167.1 hypothetical protein B5S32_g5534 [[Candida] boidinii]GME70750.1 unnamed protein product [[Candida] boidinii]
MTSRYRVEYALKQHRRDEFIEWIKGLLAVPFVLYAVKSNGITCVDEIKTNLDAKRRYAEIFYDIEKLVDDQLQMQLNNTIQLSRLKQLIPSIGSFFTRLSLEKAFYIEDDKRSISKRRLVAPSFNDIRIILNTAQILELSNNFHSDKNGLKLITFDGDVTLYDDGNSLESNSPIIPLIISLLSKDIFIGIVTAAGYSEISGAKYYSRLKGLIDEIEISDKLTDKQRENLLVMGGEANYLFKYNNKIKNLKFIETEDWYLDSMKNWEEINIIKTLNFVESALKELIIKLELPAHIIRKERGVGLVPFENKKLLREQLEEVVLRVDNLIKNFPFAKDIKVCAFNGGSDVWVDIGDKSLGVEALQDYLTKNETNGDLKSKFSPNNTLHVGDQFASVGANDFRARLSACTVWIASPEETRAMLSDLNKYIDEWSRY